MNTDLVIFESEDGNVSLDEKQVLSVIEKYSLALDLLDDYDHQTMKRPSGNKAVYVLSYEECRKIIDTMKYSSDSDVFGNEKDDSFKGSIGNIYQSFGGKDVYPSLEEKEMMISVIMNCIA